MSDRKIMTNRIDRNSISIECRLADERYNFFEVSRTLDGKGKYIGEGFPIINANASNRNILSIKYDKCTCSVYVLGTKSLSQEELESVKDMDKYHEQYTVTKHNAMYFEDKPRIFLQLFLNSLGNSEIKRYSINNLTGHLYVFSPDSIHDNTKQITGLDIWIDEDLCLQLKATAFTSMSLKGKMKLTADDCKFLNRYCIGPNKSLVKAPSGMEENELLINKNFEGKHASMTFLGLDSNTFSGSRIGILSECLDIFNDKYSDMIHFNFCSYDMEAPIIHDHKEDEPFKAGIMKMAAEKKLSIIDRDNDEETATLTSKIIDEFKNSEWNIDIQQMKNHTKGRCTIAVVHEKAWYEERKLPDPHEKARGKVIQHVTVEDFKVNSMKRKDGERIEVLSAACINALKELMIKNDIYNGKLTLIDWARIGVSEDMEFINVSCNKSGKDKDQKETYDMHSMTIHTDGSFEFRKLTENSIEFVEYRDLYRTYAENHEYIEGIVKKGDDVNIILSTGCFTMPNPLKAAKAVKELNSIRSKNCKEEILYPCLDIQSFVMDGVMHYSVGTPGNNLRNTIDRASTVRRIDPVRNSELLVPYILKMNDVLFVRYMQLTIKPFPFKYIDEYISMIG